MPINESTWRRDIWPLVTRNNEIWLSPLSDPVTLQQARSGRTPCASSTMPWACCRETAAPFDFYSCCVTQASPTSGWAAIRKPTGTARQLAAPEVFLIVFLMFSSLCVLYFWWHQWPARFLLGRLYYFHWVERHLCTPLFILAVNVVISFKT